MNSEQDLNQLAAKIEQEIWATYFIGQYYFTVNTRRYRAECGLAPGEETDTATQRRMQAENEAAMFHEYIHFVHEISIVMGNVFLSLDTALKSIFSHYFDPAMSSCEHKGIDKTSGHFKNFINFHITKEFLNGSIGIGSKLLRVLEIEVEDAVLHVPHDQSSATFDTEIPVIVTEVFEDAKYSTKKVHFGTFFLYEGLAYELDREFHRRRQGLKEIVDEKKGTEYTFTIGITTLAPKRTMKCRNLLNSQHA